MFMLVFWMMLMVVLSVPCNQVVNMDYDKSKCQDERQ